MRAAFPNKTYSVFIRTEQVKIEEDNFTARGVHTEEEIESRVKAGTGMLSTFQNMNFDFIAANKRGELPKNVKMIALEFKKWRNSLMTNPHGGKHRIPKNMKANLQMNTQTFFDDEDKENTIHGLGFKDKETAIASLKKIENSGKTFAHKMQAAMAMEQRARFHIHQTPGIKAAQKVCFMDRKE